MTSGRAALNRALIYRKAAALISSGEECAACWAINVAKSNGAQRYGQSAQRRAFERIMLTDQQGFVNHFGSWHDQACRDDRILALCFMSAMVKAGDA